MTEQRKMGSLSEEHAYRIRAAIRAAREDGVNVILDGYEDEDGMHVKLITSRRWHEKDGFMQVFDGPFIVEGY